MRDMTDSCVWHDVFRCATRLVHMCDMSHSDVWHDSFQCVTWLIHMAGTWWTGKGHTTHVQDSFLEKSPCCSAHCNMLQHTATCCNVLQHRQEPHHIHTGRLSRHCNILQHAAAYCNTLQHAATHCNTGKSHIIHTGLFARHYNTLQDTKGHCNTLQHTATPARATSHMRQEPHPKHKCLFSSRMGPFGSHSCRLKYGSWHRGLFP